MRVATLPPQLVHCHSCICSSTWVDYASVTTAPKPNVFYIPDVNETAAARAPSVLLTS